MRITRLPEHQLTLIICLVDSEADLFLLAALGRQHVTL